MKENEMNPQADPVLDAELAQMAEEVPPMPADFHAAWMSAVRAEAAKTSPAQEESEQKPPVSLNRWTRILSIAAAFVFLIGGTIIYRNSRKTLSDTVFLPEVKNEALKAEEAPAAGGAAETKEAYNDSAAAPEEAMEEAEEVTALMLYDSREEAAGAALDAEQEAETEIFGAAVSGAVMAEASEASEAAYEAGEAYEAEEAAPMANRKAAEVALTALPTAAPTMTPEPAADAGQREEAAEEPAEAPVHEAEEAGTNGGFIQAAGAFLTDMGDFLLAAMPYLLVLAVPAAAALIICRRKKK